MESLSKEEALQAMKDISGQYGGNVLVTFSGTDCRLYPNA